MSATAEQQARDMLERMGVSNAQDMTSGDLVELANLIASTGPTDRAACYTCGGSGQVVGVTGALMRCPRCGVCCPRCGCPRANEKP